MSKKIVDLSAAGPIPAPWDITREEEAEIVAQYNAERTRAAIEEDYRDFDKQVAEGIPAEQLLRELQQDSDAE